MLGKITKVAAGVTVGLVAAAPMAWAGGTGYDEAPSKDKGVKGEHVDHDKGDKGDWGHEKKHEHHFSGTVCSFNGGSAEAASLISGDSLANAVAQAPIAGNNIGNLANCSNFLNNNLNGNLSNNNVAVLGGIVP